jgi:hypothetical protein
MHPSRLVALSFVPVSVLLLVRPAVAGSLQPTVGSTLQFVGGLVLLPASLYGLARPGVTPTVTEYGPSTLLFVFGAGVWTLGLASLVVSA